MRKQEENKPYPYAAGGGKEEKVMPGQTGEKLGSRYKAPSGGKGELQEGGAGRTQNESAREVAWERQRKGALFLSRNARRETREARRGGLFDAGRHVEKKRCSNRSIY